MLGRTLAIAMNTYREAVRARVLFGLLAVALATSAYSLVIASMSLRQETRIVADIGSSSISLYAVLVAIVLGATSLYRELELKTIFPILTRRLRRHEYVVGKYLGIVATLFVFIAIDGGFVLGILALEAHAHVELALGLFGALVLAFAIVAWRAKHVRSFVALPWSVAFFAAMAFVARDAGPDRQVVVVSAALTLAEIAIVGAIAMLFSSFSSPFLTAIFTLMLFLIGRSSDTLANLPERIFGATVREVGGVLAKIVPNLNVYVPARPLLLGQIASAPVWSFVARAWANAILYAAILLAISALVFRRRDFQ